MARKRNYQWTAATRFEGSITQDKVGGSTQSVTPEVLEARLIEDGFLPAGMDSGSIEAADMATSVIDQLISEPGLKYITGGFSLAPVVPGTSQAKADALAKQVEGQAFLQAFQSLKGAGAITDVEGKKATAAIARLSRSQSQKDYTDALNELKQVATSAKQKASGVSSPAPSGAIKFLGFE